MTGYAERTRVVNRVSRGYDNGPIGTSTPGRCHEKGNFFDAKPRVGCQSPEARGEEIRAVSLDSSRGVTAQTESGISCGACPAHVRDAGSIQPRADRVVTFTSAIRSALTSTA